jgi:hypothetical protein
VFVGVYFFHLGCQELMVDLFCLIGSFFSFLVFLCVCSFLRSFMTLFLQPPRRLQGFFLLCLFGFNRVRHVVFLRKTCGREREREREGRERVS